MERFRSPYPTRGFTLVELLIVISIILALMGMVVVVGPAIIEEVRRVKTTAALKVLEQSIMRYYNEYDVCPPDSQVDGDKVDNEVFLEAMEEFQITEEKLLDGWGNQIVYDRVRDEDSEWEINDELPNDPRDEKWFDMSDEDKEDVRTRFFLWSRGKNPKSDQKAPKELLIKH
jgi:prepilin-type N-terminal cleavage/methylation domain-containing protein